jgi:hypothetical protein
VPDACAGCGALVFASTWLPLTPKTREIASSDTAFEMAIIAVLLAVCVNHTES